MLWKTVLMLRNEIMRMEDTSKSEVMSDSNILQQEHVRAIGRCFDGSDGESFFKIGVTIECFHSEGMSRKSTSERKRIDNGKHNEAATFL